MAQPRWTLYLTDEAGTQLAELTTATQKTFTYAHNGGCTATFTLPLSHPHASLITTGDTLVQAWREPDAGTRTIRFHGQVYSTEYVGSGAFDALQVVVADPFAVLAHRFTQASFSATDQGAILKSLVDAANSDNDTRVQTSSANIETTTNRTADWSSTRKAISESFREFSSMDGGCDFELRPIAYNSGKIVDLHVFDGRGSTKNAAVFSYGPTTGSNCTSMTYTRTLDGMGNVVNAYGESATTSVSTATNHSSVNSYGQHTADISYPDITNQDRLDALATQYLADHGTPIEHVSFTAGPAAPRVFDDFQPGDTIRAQGKKGAMSFTKNVVVHSVTIGVDDNGREAVSSIEGEVA